MADTERQKPDRVSKEFDPRFSRAFQPGYDPRVHREAPPSLMRREEPRSDLRGGIREVGGLVESSKFAAPDSGSHGAEGAGSTEPAVQSAMEHEADADNAIAPVVWWRRVNPWFLLLWILGAGFILAAFGLVQAVNFMSETGGVGTIDSYFSSVLFQSVWITAPMLMILGLATLTSTVVIQAARWRRA